MAEKKSDEYTNKYRSQVRQKDETLQVVKDQYSKIQHIYTEKIKTLEDTLITLKNRFFLENSKKKVRRIEEKEEFRDFRI